MCIGNTYVYNLLPRNRAITSSVHYSRSYCQNSIFVKIPYQTKSTSPPCVAMMPLTLLAKSMADSSSFCTMGGKYHTSQTIAQLVIIMYKYCIIEYLLLFQKGSPKRGSYFMATGYMILPTSKLPFLNCITDVLFMQVPSGNIKIGGFFGLLTCSFNLFNGFVLESNLC